MLAIDENTITDAALEQMGATPDPRLRQIMAAMVRHLHAFAREVDLTAAEWLDGIRFLTAVGQGVHTLSAGVYSSLGHAGAQQPRQRAA